MKLVSLGIEIHKVIVVIRVKEITCSALLKRRLGWMKKLKVNAWPPVVWRNVKATVGARNTLRFLSRLNTANGFTHPPSSSPWIFWSVSAEKRDWQAMLACKYQWGNCHKWSKIQIQMVANLWISLILIGRQCMSWTCSESVTASDLIMNTLLSINLDLAEASLSYYKKPLKT